MAKFRVEVQREVRDILVSDQVVEAESAQEAEAKVAAELASGDFEDPGAKIYCGDSDPWETTGRVDRLPD